MNNEQGVMESQRLEAHRYTSQCGNYGITEEYLKMSLASLPQVETDTMCELEGHLEVFQWGVLLVFGGHLLHRTAPGLAFFGPHGPPSPLS